MAEGTPHIRGEMREAMLHDIAQGDMTLSEIADKYGRHVQAVKQFKGRHKNRIAVIKAKRDAALEERLIGVAIADKVDRIATNGDLRNMLLEAMEDPDVDPQRVVSLTQLVRAVDKLHKAVAEEKNELPVRVQAHVDHSGTATYEIPGIDLGALVSGWQAKAAEPAEPFEPEPEPRPEPLTEVPEKFAGRNPRPGSTANVPGDSPIGPVKDPQYVSPDDRKGFRSASASILRGFTG
jgi:hypothetical protein